MSKEEVFNRDHRSCFVLLFGRALDRDVRSIVERRGRVVSVPKILSVPYGGSELVKSEKLGEVRPKRE